MGMFTKIKEVFTGGNTLYYPGCLTHFALPEIENNYKKILKMLEIDYIFLPEFNCCGSPVKNAGYKEDFHDLIQNNLDFLKKYGVKKIITNCPACYLVLKDEYNLEVEHISQTIANNLDKIDPKLAADIEGNKITYHDPCHLGRQGGVFKEPRAVIKHLGLELIELPCSREASLCCGAGAGLRNNNPDLSKKIAKARIKLCKTKELVTPCPMCYMHFKEAAKDVKILEFSELLIAKVTDKVPIGQSTIHETK